jgi:hypothetical protein
VEGAWVDDWGFDHVVTGTAWTTMGSVFNVTQYDNAADFLVAQNDGANTYSPNLWSRFDWTFTPQGKLYYCQVVFDAATEAAARGNTTANREDLAEGCNGFGWSRLGPPLAIRGDYVDDYGFDHEVRQWTWTTMGSVFHTTWLDNTARFLVAQNDEDNLYSPNLWSRFDWTHDGELVLRYCQTVFDAATEAAALATPAANAQDLAAGCNGYPWSKLFSGLEIRGLWADDWGFDHEITQTTWTTMGSVFHVSRFDNGDDYLVAQNDTDNTYNPDKWSRFDWTFPMAGDLFYCQVIFDADTESAALAATGADRDHLDTGCNGYPWSMLGDRLAIRGGYLDNNGTEHLVTQTQWSVGADTYAIAAFSNDYFHVVAQNGATNAAHAGLWSLFDWTFNTEADLRVCQTVQDAATREAAAASPHANPADFDHGCHGGAWLTLTPTDD